jgi:hypothetical protein
VNPDIDDLIRDAVRRQEELAVDPERIRTALPARTARRRRTLTVAAIAAVAVAAVAVAAAVTAPVIILREPSGGGSAVSPTSTVAPPPAVASAPLRYRPTWLPAGFVERSRSVPVSDPALPKVTTDRLWKRTSLDDGELGHLGLSTWDASDEDAGRQPPSQAGTDGKADVTSGSDVDINGSRGRYDNDVVTWQVGHTTLMLYAPGAGLSKNEMLRVARSVRPDPASLRLPLRVDWLPDGVIGEFATMQGDSPSKWNSYVMAEGDARYAYVSFGPTVPEPRGDAITVNGRAAHLASVDEDDPFWPNHRMRWLLTMDAGDGRCLTIRAGSLEYQQVPTPLVRDDVVRIAESVVLDPNPDLTWLGR